MLLFLFPRLFMQADVLLQGRVSRVLAFAIALSLSMDFYMGVDDSPGSAGGPTSGWLSFYSQLFFLLSFYINSSLYRDTLLRIYEAWLYCKLLMCILLLLSSWYSSKHLLFFLSATSFLNSLILCQCSRLFILISSLTLNLCSKASILLFDLFIVFSLLLFSPLYRSSLIFSIYFCFISWKALIALSVSALASSLIFFFFAYSSSIQLPFCAFIACTFICFFLFSSKASVFFSILKASAQLGVLWSRVEASVIFLVLSNIIILLNWPRQKLSHLPHHFHVFHVVHVQPLHFGDIVSGLGVGKVAQDLLACHQLGAGDSFAVLYREGSRVVPGPIVKLGDTHEGHALDFLAVGPFYFL